MIKTLVLFLIIFCNNSFATSKNDGIFIIDRVKVYNKSDNAQKAKKIALLEGQRKALKLLFKRVGINEDYTKFLSDDIISEMIESIKVDDEIITKNSYSSVISIIFNKTFVNFNLKKANISANKVTNNMFLYIPILENNDILNADPLWYKTSYDTFFEDEEKYKNIVIIDNYNLINSAILNKKNNLTYNNFKTLLLKYNSNTIIIAKAKYEKFSDSVVIEYREIDAENDKNKTLTFHNKNNFSESELLIEASKQTLDYLNNESEERIKLNSANNKEVVKNNNYVDVFYIIQNLKEYSYLLSLLENLDFISKYDTIKITTKVANIRIYYTCEESELTSLLNNRGFIFNHKNGKNFIDYKGF